MTPLILQCDIEAARRMLAEQRPSEDVLAMLVQRRIEPARAEQLLSDLKQGRAVRPDMEINEESKPRHGESHSETGSESGAGAKRRRRRKHSHSGQSPGRSRDKGKAATLLLFLALVSVIGAGVYFLLIRDTDSKSQGTTGSLEGTNAITQTSKPGNGK